MNFPGWQPLQTLATIASERMWSDEKRPLVTSTIRARTVRRPYQQAQMSLSRRVTRLARKLKVNNPSHLYQLSAVSAFPTISTTGTAFDLASGLAQGDNFDTRFSSGCILTHVNLKGTITPGTTAAGTAGVRITVIKAQTGAAFGSNLTGICVFLIFIGSYSPIVTNTAIRLYYDKFFQVGSSGGAGQQWPVNINLSLKLRHSQKFTGVAAGTQTGESIYLIVQSNAVAGTTAPIIAGVLEVYFQPT